MRRNLGQLALPRWLVWYGDDESVLAFFHEKQELPECRVNRLLFLLRRQPLDFDQAASVERVFGNYVYATVFRMAANERPHGYERSLRLLGALGLVWAMSAAVCALHGVHINLHAPAILRVEAVFDKPAFDFKLVHGGTTTERL